MFYKPGDCVTARHDALHKTVMDYIPDKRKGLSPVGRLDLDTEGLLLITDDGMLSHNLLSPVKHVEKVYEAKVLGRVTVLTEGRFHQVKRMFSAVGMQVLFLKRVAMGGLWLDDALVPGEYRQLKEEERKLLGVQITSGSRRGNG